MVGWLKKKEKGTTAVEFALALPFFLVVFAGMLDFGGYFWTKHVATQAAREGARLAILDDATEAEVIAYVKEQVKGGGVGNDPTVTVTETHEGKRKEVDVWVDYDFIMLGDLMSLIATSENAPTGDNGPTGEDVQMPDVLNVHAAAFESKHM